MTQKKTLKELVSQYTNEQIFREAAKEHGLFVEDYISLLEKIETIRNASDLPMSDRSFMFLVAFPKKRTGMKPFLFAGISQNGRKYKLTYQTARKLELLSTYMIPVDEAHPSEFFGATELQYLVLVLLSINAFSDEVIDSYFDGNVKSARSDAYIYQLREAKRDEFESGIIDPPVHETPLSDFDLDPDNTIVGYHGSDCSIVIPRGIEAIGSGAFLGNSLIQSVSFPGNVSVIGDRAFYGCTALESVVLPKSIRSIGNYAFSGCPNLSSVACESEVLEHMGIHPFDQAWISKQSGPIVMNGFFLGYVSNQSDMSVLKIPDGTHTISREALFFPEELMGSVQALVLPDSVTVIEEEAFSSFSSLELIDLGSGLRQIHDRAFMLCENDLTFLHGENVEYVGYHAIRTAATFWGGSDVLRKAGNEYSVWGRRFEICEGTTEVTGLVFRCKELDVVYIPGSVRSITNTTFEHGIHIETPFWSYAHHYAELHSIPVCARWEKLDQFQPFDQYSSLESLQKNEQFDCVEKIIYASSDSRTDSEFYALLSRCKNLKEFLIAPGCQTDFVADGEILYCHYGSSLACVAPRTPGFLRIREGTDYLFMESIANTDVSEIQLPETLQAIDDSAFYNCPNLKRIYIPSQVSDIGDQTDCDSPIVWCPSLESIEVSPENRFYFSLDGVLYSARSNTLLSYPGGRQGAFVTPDFVMSYAQYAFCGCRGLTSITISPNVWYIHSYIFKDCSSLQSIRFPFSIKRIDLKVFEGCKALKDIFILNPDTELENMDSETFTSIGSERIMIHVDMGTAAELIGKEHFFDLDLTIQESDDLKPYALYNWTCLMKMQLPETLKTIGASALEGCTSLRELSIPKGVVAIGEDAFLGCDKLHLIVYRNSFAEEYAENCGIPYSFANE